MEANWAGTIMNIIDKITKLVLINILWVLFVILGLGIFGFMPATAAVNTLIRKLIAGEELANTYKSFWKEYKASFKSANIAGLVFFVFGLFLYIDINVLFGTDSLIGKSMLAILFMISIIYFATLLHFFPLYARYEMKTLNYIKLAFVMAMSKPLTTLLMVLWLFVVVVITLQYTVILPLLFITMISIGINWLSIKQVETKIN